MPAYLYFGDPESKSYLKAFNEFSRIDSSTPCGRSHISSRKKCKKGAQASLKSPSKSLGIDDSSNDTSEKIEAVMKKLEIKRSKDPDYKGGEIWYDVESDRPNPGNLGVVWNEEKYKGNDDEWGDDVEKKAKDMVAAKPPGYYDNGWGVENEYEAKHFKLKDDEKHLLRRVGKKESAKKQKAVDRRAFMKGLPYAAAIAAGLTAYAAHKISKDKEKQS